LHAVPRYDNVSLRRVRPFRKAGQTPARKRLVMTLQELAALRGRPTRTFSAAAADGSPEVGARWGCGCVAVGPSFERLALSDERCQVHQSQRSQTTLRLQLPDL
jgi:hypothetical protein